MDTVARLIWNPTTCKKGLALKFVQANSKHSYCSIERQTGNMSPEVFQSSLETSAGDSERLLNIKV
jgi:hypothetical protein